MRPTHEIVSRITISFLKVKGTILTSSNEQSIISLIDRTGKIVLMDSTRMGGQQYTEALSHVRMSRLMKTW